MKLSVKAYFLKTLLDLEGLYIPQQVRTIIRENQVRRLHHLLSVAANVYHATIYSRYLKTSDLPQSRLTTGQVERMIVEVQMSVSSHASLKRDPSPRLQTL